ncbi:twitching motility protein PilT [Bacteroidia bacterium]|nr:twitching motility protein PilT [Bacteroidia bacterium]GHT50918.1 twitching motility protein PilT [Bacteroidia bacterium]
MIQYILDTNICVFFLRGKLNFNEFTKVKWRESCCVSEVTVLELHYGAENSNNPKKHHEAVNAFLQDLTVLSVSKCADFYSKEKTRFRKMGKPLHDEFDLIIGSSAIVNDLTLVTDNVKHFKDFENIKIDNWFRNND